MSGYSAAASAGVGIAGPLIGAITNKYGIDTTNAANAKAAQDAMDFSKEMSNTAWVRGVADMRNAGLNPALAYGQGGASAPTGQTYQAQNPYQDVARSIGQGISNANDIYRNRREDDLSKSTISMNAASARQAEANAVLLKQLAVNAGYDESGKKADAELWDALGATGKAASEFIKVVPFGALGSKLIEKGSRLFKRK